MLAARVVQAAEEQDWDDLPLLAGILVGNGCTGTKTVSCGAVPGGSFTGSGFGQQAEYAHMHALIPDRLWQQIQQCSPTAFDLYAQCWYTTNEWDGKDGCEFNDPEHGWVPTNGGAGKDCTESCEFECFADQKDCCRLNSVLEEHLGHID